VVVAEEDADPCRGHAVTVRRDGGGTRAKGPLS
jgi:hypothetical protein